MIKLLLVEDDANLCYIIRGGLEDMIGGYEVMTASNGEEGLKSRNCGGSLSGVSICTAGRGSFFNWMGPGCVAVSGISQN